jgi:F-type H+-transporting ATPase subunit gamma
LCEFDWIELTTNILDGLQVSAAGMKEIRDRIASVKNTSKITEVYPDILKKYGLARLQQYPSTQAMKLVAAAKVRRAQEAVINSRPFSENLVKVS